MTTNVKPNDIQFTLSIKLDVPPAPMSEFLLNLRADNNAKLVDIKVCDICRWDDTLEDLIAYSEEQLNNLVIFDKNTIEFKDEDHSRKTYHFPTNRVTIRQFVDAIVDFEKISRPKSEWFGGIDCHHIFYEGIYPDANGTYSIFWGS